MSITAVIEKEMIKFPADVPGRSGTVVRIEALEQKPPALFGVLKDLDGIADDLPAGLSGNLDHYVRVHC